MAEAMASSARMQPPATLHKHGAAREARREAFENGPLARSVKVVVAHVDDTEAAALLREARHRVCVLEVVRGEVEGLEGGETLEPGHVCQVVVAQVDHTATATRARAR